MDDKRHGHARGYSDRQESYTGGHGERSFSVHKEGSDYNRHVISTVVMDMMMVIVVILVVDIKMIMNVMPDILKVIALK